MGRWVIGGFSKTQTSQKYSNMPLVLVLIQRLLKHIFRVDIAL